MTGWRKHWEVISMAKNKKNSKTKNDNENGDTAKTAKKKLLKAKRKNLKSQKLKSSIEENNTNDSVGPDTLLPRHNQVADLIMKENHIKTIADPGNDREPVYIYKDGYYIRAEETLKELINSTYINEITRNYTDAEKKLKKEAGNSSGWLTELYRKSKAALNRGCTTNLVNEAMNAIRRQTFVDESEINPKTHIPFQNGNLNIATWELEAHNPDSFFVWQIKANYDPSLAKMSMAPKFQKYLLDVFYPLDIPMVLEYLGYCLYPKFPAHKVLDIVGKEGMGKGVITRILDGLLGVGFMSIDLNRLLTAQQFQFSGIEKANVVADAEVNRKFKKGTVVSFRNFNNLFGSDPLYIEKKFHEGEKGKLSVKGIFLSNLPVFNINDAAAFRRKMPIQVKTERKTKDIPDIDKIILEERDAIVSILIRYLKALERRSWIFSNELENDSVSELWDHFANSIQYFIDENLIYQEGAQLKVDDTYNTYVAWCKTIGMEPVKKQSFTSYVGKVYPKRNAGPRGNRYYVFSNCTMENNDDTPENQDKLEMQTNEAKPVKNKFDRFNRYGVHLKYKTPPGRPNIAAYSQNKETNETTDNRPDNSTLNSSRSNYNIDNLPVGPVKDELVQNKEDIENEKLKHPEEKSKQQPAETLPENANQEITKDFIEEIRETLETENFMLDGNHGLSFDKKDFQLYVHPTDLPLDRFTRLKDIMKGFGFQYSLIQAPYGIRFIRKIRGGINE